ncbi:winged helix-turn-helix domain-containing protein [Nocardiopsis sp. HNM0947]|uniref:Winged helix-turn-helix domain-containing protein n=1 Tax=Nocardiopsis coralli TaxID=2772213 RepID=A0ABR9P6R1_9ACTN|nr:BTAD domain-containing putative transcriptional regulator [Nocardiopsis coralli]MBE2999531.1 winged helix-turn-helix domain-containing protein [Nocardiopsis coralli]
MDQMEFQIFGPLRVRDQAHEATVGGHLQRVLLGVLLCRANAVVPAHVLIDAMWGGHSTEGTTARLHLHVHRLRRLLPRPERLDSEPGGYRLTVHPGEIDAERFETLLEEGTALGPHDPDRAAELIRKALDLWEGPPFEGLDVPHLVDTAHRLEERHQVALQELFTAELARGRHGAVLGELAEQVRRHPLDEHLHALLMVAHHRAGQPGRALSVYHRARRHLREELGQDPGPELRRIEQCVLAGRPADLAAPAPSPRPPAQLPHQAHGFTGREHELATLDTLLRPDTSGPHLLTGTGGVGKTTLAVHWAHRARTHFPDGQLYIDLRGHGPHPPLPPEEALAAFLRALGVEGASVPTGLDERAARFRSLIAGRRLLVLLDNARSAEQVRPLLPGTTTARTLITSRNTLPALVAREGAHRQDLERLTPERSLDLLHTLVGARTHDEPGAAAELAERCAHLPLALRVAAELVNTSPGQPIADLTEELAQGQHALQVLDADGDEATSVRTVLSWSYRQLPPEAARALRLLAAHPGHDLDLHTAAALTGAEPARMRGHVRTLLRAHLLEEHTPGRYRMHDLLRAYALDLSQDHDSDDERHAAAQRLYRHCLATVTAATEAAHGPALTTRAEQRCEDASGHAPAEDRPGSVPPLPDAATAARWLEANRADLVHITQHAARTGNERTAVDLACALRRHLSLGGHHDHALAVHTSALSAARALQDAAETATAHRCLGSVHRRLGRIEAATEHMQDAHTCLLDTDLDREQLLQLIQLAVMNLFQAQYRQAAVHLHRARRRADDLGEAGHEIQVGAHAYLGFFLHLLRRDARALDHLTRARALVRQEEASRVDTEAITGYVHIGLARPERARAHFELARTMARERGNRFVQAWVHPLALAYWALGMREQAFATAEECLAVALGSNERLIEPSARNTLGTLLRMDGSAREGLAQHRAALSAAQGCSIRYCEANAHRGIGEAHALLGQDTDAREHWDEAATLFGRIGVPLDTELRLRMRRG